MKCKICGKDKELHGGPPEWDCPVNKDADKVAAIEDETV